MGAYNPNDVTLNLLGITVQGLFDGTPIELEFMEAGMSLHSGVQGFTSFVINANQTGTLKFVTSQKSPSNAALSAAYAAHAIGPMLMKDSSDDTVTKASGARVAISKHAPIKRGKEIQGYEWEVLIERLVMAAGGDL